MRYDSWAKIVKQCHDCKLFFEDAYSTCSKYLKINSCGHFSGQAETSLVPGYDNLLFL